MKKRIQLQETKREKIEYFLDLHNHIEIMQNLKTFMKLSLGDFESKLIKFSKENCLNESETDSESSGA